MTTTEFSDEFDILYNNISSNQAPGLTEYEKSVFLTSAQDALVLELVTGKNAIGESFEKTEELRQYLTDIIKTAEPIQNTKSNRKPISKNSTFYTSPEDLWFVVYENVKFEDGDSAVDIEVIPVTHDEYSRISKNPFRRASKNRVLRLNIGGDIELVSDREIKNYSIRYIEQLSPIIIEDLDYGTVKGVREQTECKLNPALHEAILARAVQIVKVSMGAS